MATKIKVKLSSNSYPILLGNESLDKVIEMINKLSASKCLIIIDKNVLKYHSTLIRRTFALLDCKTHIYIFIPSEKNKSLNHAEKIYTFLVDNSFDRNSVIVAIGGGITGDTSGFVASSYMRGIRLIQIPTTLLSMVDSSVGGKTGININYHKNLIGTFYQPELVTVYPDFLKTLPVRELRSGAGEIFKYAFLADDKNYELLKSNLKKIFSHRSFDIVKTILSCLKIKAKIVESDEKEKIGLRKILNLGHTFGHAFESTSNYKLKHGEAVIGGIYCALFLSESLGYLSSEKLNKIIYDFEFIRPVKQISLLNADLILKHLKSDKKTSFGKNKFVLIEDIGNIVVDVVVTNSFVGEAIKRMKLLI